MKANKVLSLLLVAVILFSVLPMSVWAESAVSDFEYTIIDGEVTITDYTGAGGDVVIPSEIEGYPVTRIACAFDSCESLTNVTIPKTVIEIDTGVFGTCFSLKSISVDKNNKFLYSKGNCIIQKATDVLLVGSNISEIPPDVKAIGPHAFSNCIELKSITIPESVDRIESWAFSDCVSLISVTIPEGVIEIGASAFSGCTSLTSIAFPSSVSSFGFEVLRGCDALTSIAIDSANKCYYSEGNCIVESQNSKVIQGCNVSVIPNGLKMIGFAAFYGCTALDSVTIPDSVTVIEPFAFAGCQSLANITIPDRVETIYDNAFSNCSLLTSIVIPDSVTYIQGGVFSGCEALTSITVDANNAVYHSDRNCIIETATGTLIQGCNSSVIPNGVTRIGGCAFMNFNLLTSVTIPDSVTSIGAEAFASCGSLTSIEIPNSVTDIEHAVFFGCTSMTSVTLSNSITCIMDMMFYDCVSLKSIVIPDGVTYIMASAFNTCTSLTNVVIPDSVIMIEIVAFANCTSLKNIVIPDSVMILGEMAFCDCSSLKDIYCVAESQPETWDKNWNGDCYATVHWGTNGFDVPTEPEETIGFEYAIIDGEVTITGYTGDGGDVVIPSEINGYPVVCIGNSAFSFNNSITSVAIPDSVREIGITAFGECDSLTEITIPASVDFMGLGAFVYSDNLQNIYCEAKSQPEGWDTFWFVFCDATIWFDGVKLELEHQFLYEINDGEVTITGYSGDGVNVVIPSEIEGYPVVYIGKSAFYGNDSIWSVAIPDSIRGIDDMAFYLCSELREITLSDSLLSIGVGAFGCCYALFEITIPASVEYMANNIFMSSYNLQNIYCEAESQPEGWRSNWIGRDCFATVHWGVEPEPEITYGDVNGDGVVNGLDVTRLLNYLANYDYTNGTSTVEVSEGADCNGDGIIDGRDSIRLLRYLAGYDPSEVLLVGDSRTLAD